MRGRFENLIRSSKPVLVDFHAEWCGPCKAMAPVLKSVKDKLKDNVRIIKVDVDKNPFIATQYNIRSVPALKIFKEGNIRWAGSGVMDPEDLVNIIRKL